MRAYQNPAFISEMRIPDHIFGGASVSAPAAAGIKAPQCPVLAFINSKSGGQLGAELLKSYQMLLSPKQVFDLGRERPENVLHVFFSRLEKLKRDGDKVAESIQRSLKIIVAGGDGTAGWLLGVIGDLKLSYPPPIATVPLGTGNNLPYSFGWGKKNPGTDVDAAKKFLFEVYGAKPMNIDSWHIVMKMATPTKSLEPVKLPHALHPFKRVSESDALYEAGTQVFRGGFWNYFSIGMDAQVAYEFHKKRQEHPEMFKKQLINQGAYAKITVSQGWFCSRCDDSPSRNIKQMVIIYIQQRDGLGWKKLAIPEGIGSIVMLNLPSFSGGLNPWGTPNSRKSSERQLTPAFVNDGLIEIVGFRDAWHGLALLTPGGHGTRLAQAHKIRMNFVKGSASETYMRMDGEPWLQPLPDDENAKTVLEITNLGQAVMLATSNCIARCVPHESGKVNPIMNNLSNAPLRFDEPKLEEGYEKSDGGSCSSEKDMEVRRKFGAADTFKMRQRSSNHCLLRERCK